jgi:hypothetical protein
MVGMGSGSRLQDSWFRVLGFGFLVSGLGESVLGLRVSCSGYRIWGAEFGDYSSGYR